MKFSVIVPIYNVEQYLPFCIESVLNQSFKDFELILVNDGSTDNSLSVCKKYADKDKRIRLIHSDKKSYGYQINLGIRTDAVSVSLYIYGFMLFFHALPPFCRLLFLPGWHLLPFCFSVRQQRYSRQTSELPPAEAPEASFCICVFQSYLFFFSAYFSTLFQNIIINTSSAGPAS